MNIRSCGFIKMIKNVIYILRLLYHLYVQIRVFWLFDEFGKFLHFIFLVYK